jgi:aminopeptidase N
LAKAPLFYIEMEDACGEAPVRAGLAHMVASMRGQQVDYHILRSVLEESTGRDLAKLFREWLDQKGIPANFRGRYRYGEGAEEMGN